MFCTFSKVIDALDEKLAKMDEGIKGLQKEVDEAKAEAKELRRVVSELKEKAKKS